MKNNLGLLTEKERSDFSSLASCLGITTEELLQLKFHNENIFDDAGVSTKVKYVFDENNPSEILQKVKGLDSKNSVVLYANQLSYNL